MNQPKTNWRKKILMKNNRALIPMLFLICGLNGLAAASPSDESDVRNAVQHIFNQLKSGQYGSLYDSLPSSSRARISRERLVQGLQRSQNVFQLQRIEIGAVRVSGNLAVVDTVMYAHLSQPFDSDGKLVVQQYLIREDGAWRVATGDNATINTFLKNNPSFGRKFPIRKPQAFINQDGKWIPVPLGRP
ncbi:MAG TPA: hypothetical protein VLN44_09075 [Pyrinomonadaceae bacterium]|nr:hypothetical protein [Pyrinomonadaceae bacterium]